MKSEIKKRIDQIYQEKDYRLFVQLSQSKFSWREEFIELCKKYCREAVVFEHNETPHLRVILHYSDTKIGNFEARYSSDVSISKIANVFYLCHSFEVINFDPERIEPTLGNYYPLPYVVSQWNFEQFVIGFLQEKGFSRLTERELYEVASLEELPENALFGSQLTVYNALFEDVCDLYSKGKTQV